MHRYESETSMNQEPRDPSDPFSHDPFAVAAASARTEAAPPSPVASAGTSAEALADQLNQPVNTDEVADLIVAPAPLAESNAAPPALSVAQAWDWIAALEAEVGQVLVGQREVLRQVVVALLAGGHVLVEGLPGLGKTLLLRSLAQVVGGRFARVQFTPDLMPSDITGHVLYDQRDQRFHLRRGPVFCHFLLSDEINRAPAKTQAALLEAMQERQVTIEGQSHPLPQPFMVLATQNPLEQEGTYALPQAQLDRFLINVQIDYPSAEEEYQLVSRVTHAQVGDQLDLSPVRCLFDPLKVSALQHCASQIQVDQAVVEYLVRLVRSTRRWPGLEAGAGPRAAIALLRCARAQALAEGKDFVTPDDVKAMALPVLRHRVRLSPDLEIGGQHVDDVLKQLIQSVDAPRQ